MRFDIITILPCLFDSVFSGGILKRAIEKGLIQVQIHNLRNYTEDKHKQVDDRPFGGGQGMVMKPEPIFNAVEHIQEKKGSPVYLLSPQGKKFDSGKAKKWSGYEQIILVCGRYEGVDERVIRYLITDEISIGDYILSGGEYASLVIVDAVSRFIPGVVGKEESVQQDSFSKNLFDFPQYTRPRDFRGMKVPSVLFSGDHRKIGQWRREESLKKTWIRRPDLMDKDLSEEDKAILGKIKSEKKGKNHESDESC